MTKDPRPRTVIIAGAGIVGAAAAYFLAQRGVEVLLLDADAPAAQATGAADGAVSVASKRPGPMMTAARAGVALYAELARDGLFADVYKPRSTFIVAASELERGVLEAHAAALDEAGVDVSPIATAELRRRFPALSQQACNAVEVHGEGHAIGYQIVHRLLSAAAIVVRRDCRADELLIEGGRVAGLQTNQGILRADAVVIAAGTGSAGLLGLDGVLRPRKGQLLVTERAPALNAAMPGAIMSGRYLLSKGSQKGAPAMSGRGYGLVIDPLRTGQFLIGGSREESADWRSNDLDAVSQILADAIRLVPGLAQLRLLRAFAGVRTAVVDGLPLIGRAGGFDNLFVATGFEGDGICLGPVTGKAISQLICGETPDIDLAPFDPARFSSREVFA
ncbi:MAG: NAD(P)/FAD-dependent oxidoreductase [Allorhizobium sp.]